MPRKSDQPIIVTGSGAGARARAPSHYDVTFKTVVVSDGITFRPGQKYRVRERLFAGILKEKAVDPKPVYEG